MSLYTEQEALKLPGNVVRHYKGGIYRERVIAKLTDDAKAGEEVVVYEHLWPHDRSWFVRPRVDFDGFVGSEQRFKPVKWDPVLNEDDVFFCSCHSDEHMFKLSYDPDEAELFLSVYLYQGRNFFKRVWEALKYIFGQKARWGHWETIIVKDRDVERMKAIVDRAAAADFNVVKR